MDIISDVNLPYSEAARRYLIEMGFPKERIYVTGSPMAEVLESNLAAIKASDIHSRLSAETDVKIEKGRYILLSAHREENIDTEKNFLSLFNAINVLAEKCMSMKHLEALLDDAPIAGWLHLPKTAYEICA